MEIRGHVEGLGFLFVCLLACFVFCFFSVQHLCSRN
ncbi:rCG49672 [Rattus norvegicus]|uniref:RCG49672 n=1 Tax=Rattus norvegicus TaxID=10116 RepID=A6K2D3_RAT|nr:rCG49672 [Rattus norvegicus]